MKSGLPIDVASLLRAGDVEGLRVEYKADWNDPCGGSALRTFCAFANDLLNVNGGYVLFGVEEQEGRPVLPVRGIDEERLDRVQQEIRGATHRIYPGYTPVVVVERVGDRCIVVVWCPGGDARPYEAPESLAPKAPRKTWVRLGSATVEARGELARRLHEVAARVPFDDRAAYDAELTDVSAALLQEHLVQAGSRLATEGLDTPTLCRRLQLSKRTNGHEVPRNAALLFFADDPTRWFHGATIEVASLPGGRAGEQIIERRFGGPLTLQIRGALDYLRGMVSEQVRKHADRADSDRVAAWPFEAIEEALVNAVLHRGYDGQEPTKVEILPDKMRIVSYPGPVDGVTLASLAGGEAPPAPSRNRRIAEMLREVRLAEARGTGVPRIRAAMLQNGSPPPTFRFDESRTYFELTLPIHPVFLPEQTRRSQPLRLGRPAPPSEVVGRADLVARIWRMLEAQSLALIGPPGRGVSSLLGAVEAAAPNGTTVIAVHGAQLSLAGLVAAIDATSGVSALDGDLAAAITRLPGDRVVVILDDAAEDADSGRGWSYALAGTVRADERVRVVLGGTTAPALDDAWVGTVRYEPVPPLTEADAVELATRLTSAESGDVDTCRALAELSGGAPGVLTQLAHSLRVEGGRGLHAVELALDHLLVERGDPTGLRTRVEQLRTYILPNGYAKLGDVPRALLTAIARDPAGLRRLDVIASTVTPQRPRLDVLAALRTLELEGFVVDVDGRLRFEHPVVREAAVAALLVPPPPPGPDDIPF